MIVAKEKYKHFNIVWIAKSPLDQARGAIAEYAEGLVPSISAFYTQLNELTTIIKAMTETMENANR